MIPLRIAPAAAALAAPIHSERLRDEKVVCEGNILMGANDEHMLRRE